jgi:UDP-glucose 4-epimerase
VSVLVIGGTGFLGRHLLRSLAKEDVRVKAYGRRRVTYPEKVDYVYGDLLDRSRLRHALEGVDCVFHFAWTTVPQTSNEDPQADVQGNVVAGIGLLDACRDAGVRTVVFPSSGGTVYGAVGGDGVVTESHPTNPISSYGITKLAFEKYLALYRHMHGLDYRVLRISNAYGEGQQPDRPQGLIGVVLRRIAAGEPVHVWGDGTVVRDYIYAGDAIDCCLRAASTALSDSSPRMFNVGTERGHSVSEVLATIASVTGREPVVEYTPARDLDVPRSVLSSRLAEDVLGWQPRTTLADGVARTWEWVLRTAAMEEDRSRGLTFD